MAHPIPFSILDLAHIGQDKTVHQAVRNSQQTAQLAETQGFERVWLAEHHGMRGVASAATAVMLAGVGAATSKIRIGSGGVMLPNHSPLVIAEQFGTLDALYPGRIDLGLGRAPGTDMATARALRRDLSSNVNDYPADVQALQDYLADDSAGGPVLAVPGAGSNVPLWLLGSSLYSAQLAGKMGLPYSFASHFAPDALHDAIRIYKMNFQPSAQLQRPYVSAGVMAVVADTEEEAQYLFSSVQQQFANLRRGLNEPMPAPVDNLHGLLSAGEIHAINSTLRYAVVGTPAQVQQQLADFIADTGIDEIILSFPITDDEKCHQAIRQVGAMTEIKSAPSWQ
ncbi:LLM class flavin-dependent oxidoreductase [Salinimonas lutimaris]|uniref:LLM class flavin-dependent oxidoreductase n=1 Tax=Salinimonas lutimaris TaxID=914153 RepID=UPI0010C06DE6|nr:LLM class flavin-dependent oxidoreductase [Salinimonas lutimaris]